MKIDYSEVAKVGLKLILALAGTAAIYSGITKLFDEKKTTRGSSEDKDCNQIPPPPEESPIVQEEEQPKREEKSTGEKIVRGLRIGQSVIGSLISVISGIGSVISCINKMFDPKYYENMAVQPDNNGYAYGDYPWNRPADPGLPMNTPIYRGNDGKGEPIWWLRKKGNVVEVW